MDKYMIKQLSNILEIAAIINERQDEVFIQVEFWANDMQRLAIAIRSKKDNSKLKYMQTYLNNNPLVNWDNILDIFDDFLGGEI